MAEVAGLLRTVLRHGDMADVRFVRRRHVPDQIFDELALGTHSYAVASADEDDEGWLVYSDGIISWWQDAAGLTDDERYRLHKFRSDIVEWLEDRGLADRPHPRATPLRVRDEGAVRLGNPDWVRDEIVLALHLFVRANSLNGNALLGKSDPQVVELSAAMSSLPVHPRHQRGPDFRNPTGVALKLANFRAIERDVKTERGVPGADNLPKGMRSYSALDRAVFEEFYDRDFEGLRDEASSILATVEEFDDAAEVPLAEDRDVEVALTSTYEAWVAEGGMRTRSEHVLVERYSQWMRQHDHEVVSRRYRLPGIARPLLCDVLVRDLNLLVEAKSSDSRPSIRMAVGQLLDYRRFEDTDPSLALLLPHPPSDDLGDFLASVDIAWIVPRLSKDGFRDSKGGKYSGSKKRSKV